jgi:GDP-L-fucose synthase
MNAPLTKNAKIYIAGHRGLVGAAILARLTTTGYTHVVTRTSTELDLKRQAEVEAFFEREKPEYVFLAAGKVGGILANSIFKAEFIYDNIMIATNVIDAAYRSGVKKLLNLGSSCIYPKFAPQPMHEGRTSSHRPSGADERTLCHCENSRDQALQVLS